MNNNSIIELAQILTGALDENFVVSKKNLYMKLHGRKREKLFEIKMKITKKLKHKKQS